MKTAQPEIFTALSRERRYQDGKWGLLDERHHGVGEWILIMQVELEEARQAWCKGHFNTHALEEILQVIAVGVACLEQHGVVEREGLSESEESVSLDIDNDEEVVDNLVYVVDNPYFYQLGRLDDDDTYWYCEFLVCDRYIASPPGKTRWEACRNGAKFLKEHVDLWRELEERKLS